jgi:predicted dehydrogenase
MKTLNFAILGCGKIGTKHAEKMRGVDYVKLVAVCDIVPERAKMLAEKHVCKSYTKLEDLLKDPEIDFVNICTPSGLHPKHSIQALNAGKNVLCEKPMALTVKDAKKMVATAKKNKKLLYVVKQNRYNPPVKLAKQLFDEGKLGKPIMCIVNMLWNRNDAYYKSDPWRGTLALDGGTIYTQAIHFVDLMLMFMGKPKRISGMTGTLNHKIEIEDTGSIQVEFANKAIGSINYTTCATKKNFEGSITLIFSKGTIKIGGEYINTIEYFEVEGVNDYKLENTETKPNDYGTYRGSMSNHDQVFKDIMERTNKSKSQSFLASNDESIDTIRFVEMALKSSASKKQIKL